MRLARTGWPQKMHHFRPINKFELRECEDAALVERGLEGEVEARQSFYSCEPGPHERRLDAAVLTQRELLHEQVIERLDTVDLALLDLAQRDVEHFQRARHLQCYQALLDAVDGHDRPLETARRSPTA